MQHDLRLNQIDFTQKAQPNRRGILHLLVCASIYHWRHRFSNLSCLVRHLFTLRFSILCSFLHQRKVCHRCNLLYAFSAFSILSHCGDSIPMTLLFSSASDGSRRPLCLRNTGLVSHERCIPANRRISRIREYGTLHPRNSAYDFYLSQGDAAVAKRAVTLDPQSATSSSWQVT